MTTVKEIIAEMKDPSPEDIALVEKAYVFAEKVHAPTVRYSGEPYFTHPAAAAKILAELGMDGATVAAGLLHDTVEDAEIPEEEIEKEFGKEVRFLVEGVTKLGKHKYRGAERHAESLRRLLVATASDIRVLIVKLADRYHNMTTLDHVPAEKRRRIALETLEIYCALADRLGMGSLKRELEDLAFPYIDQDAYQHTLEMRKQKSKETEAGLARAQKELQKVLARRGIKNFRTSIRIKGLWSLHQKLVRKKDDIDSIHDIAALRIIVDTVDECYTTLGVIHSLWKPLPGELKDYIALPKPNGYQSIHTTVLTPEAGIVEMQIRTEEMHQHAQYGIASHMSYKQLGKEAPKSSYSRLSLTWVRDLLPGLLNFNKVQPDEKRTSTTAPAPQWLSELAEAHSPDAGSEDFVEGLKSDFFSHRLFVFTPRGDVIDLPIGSTAIDFAYAIHSELGDHMNGARVNGKMVSFDKLLQDGDVVEILERASAKPTRKWLDYARTTLARRHIRVALGMDQRGTISPKGELKPIKIRKKRAPKDYK